MGKNIYLKDSERYVLLWLLDEEPIDQGSIERDINHIYKEGRTVTQIKRAIMKKLED